jgi:hypothetical protein
VRKFYGQLLLILVVVGLGTSLVVMAQNDTAMCPALVEKALAEITDNCGGMQRNTACYGFNRVDATFVSETPDNFFSQPADRAELITLDTIQNAPLNVELNRWGITLMTVQANIPNTLPGQAVVFMLIGDVEVKNAVPADSAFEGVDPVTVTTLVNANLRSFPSLNANVVSSVPIETDLQADGLSPDSDWLRVLGSTGPAWISRSLVSSDADLSTLPAITEETRSPMQAFYFTTGYGQPNCEEAPPSLLLVQGPEHIAVDINANGADIQIGSTIVLKMLENGQMQLMVISGTAYVDGLSIPAGFTATVQINDDGTLTVGPWTNLRPMTQEELDSLAPLEHINPILLNYPIVIPSLSSILAHQNAINSGGNGGNGGNNGGGSGVPGIEVGPAAGSADCTNFRATSPIGRAPYDKLPFFWDPAPGATSYVVNIYASDGSLRGTYPMSGSTNVGVDTTRLGPEKTYFWEVQAFVNGQLACITTQQTILLDDPPPGPTPTPTTNYGPPKKPKTVCGNEICESPYEDYLNCPADCGM